ncbi:MAG: type III pantothenate kinase [Pyrinomonadaceae bacterium]
MFLAIDIGNTSIKFGVFDGDDLTSKFIIPTRREYTARDIDAAADGALDGRRFAATLVSSVVPELDAAFAEYLAQIVGVEPAFVKTSDDFSLVFNFPIDEAGTDRLVNSFAAVEKYGAPCIVVAFGTATTIDVIDRDREHRGGLIAPGPATTAKALQIVASKLPEVDIAEPPNVISTTTVTAIQSGIFYSQIGLVETAVPHIKAEIGDDARVIATGGFAHLIADKCRSVEVVEPELTLEGLMLLNKRADRIARS